MSEICLRPCYRAEWSRWVPEVHRHHKQAPLQAVLAIAAEHHGAVVGIVLVERPKAGQTASDPRTLEVSRLALTGTHPRNAGTRLLGAAWRAAAAMGCHRLVSYTRTDEEGIVYRAASWHPVCTTPARSWPKERAHGLLPGIVRPASEPVPRVRWEIGPECRCGECSTRRAAA